MPARRHGEAAKPPGAGPRTGSPPTVGLQRPETKRPAQSLFVAVVVVVRWIGGPWHAAGPPYTPPPNRTALDILKERFARGEIDRDEFEERRRLLGD